MARFAVSFSQGNSCGMPWEYNQKVNNNNNNNNNKENKNKLLAETIIWMFADKDLLFKRLKDITFFYIYFVQIIFFEKNLYMYLTVVKTVFRHVMK